MTCLPVSPLTRASADIESTLFSCNILCLAQKISMKANCSYYIYGLIMQKRCNSRALAMELRLFCIKPLIYAVCKIIGRPRRPINRLGDLEVRLGGPLGDQIFLSPKDIKVFHDALFCLKSISNTIVCNPQNKNILKSMCQQCNDLKLTLILNGPPNIDRTTQSATMVGPLDQPWFLPILHTVYVMRNMFYSNHLTVSR